MLSVGHPTRRQRPTIEQREKSWYMLLFQFEGVAEEMLQRDDWRLMREWLRGDGDVERYVADLVPPGALTAALNWYRANAARRELRERPRSRRGRADARHLEQRRPLPDRGADGRLRRARRGEWRYERIEGASHWMQLDAPERVNELLLEWFRA